MGSAAVRERNGVVVEVKTMFTMGENALADSSVLADNGAAAVILLRRVMASHII